MVRRNRSGCKQFAYQVFDRLHVRDRKNDVKFESVDGGVVAINEGFNPGYNMKDDEGFLF